VATLRGEDPARTCPESTIALMTGLAIAPLAAQNPERAVALSATRGTAVCGARSRTQTARGISALR
jgi:hypothetical protein